MIATITYRGRTETVEGDVRGDFLIVHDVFVATIGAGKAKYPAYVKFLPVAEGQTAPRTAIQATTEDGRSWVAPSRVVVRNRQALVSGWAEDVTNNANQRKA